MTSTISKYQLVTGLEIHAELKTKSGMFCSCKNDPFGAEAPNTHTCPVCLGMPGALPVANKQAIEWAIMVGLALNCKINMFSKFDRKHYFYPDLAKGYQISQYDFPFCYDGYLETSEGRVKIRRIHLEEDTAKLMHGVVDGQKVSLIDFNRSGVPLLEIVTEPDIRTAKQAKEVSKQIRQLLRYLDVSDCNMQEGGMRLEANVSMAEAGADGEVILPAYKVEIKNINSFKFMEQAIEYEVVRHTEILEKGEIPDQETRGWNANKSETFTQRRKEEADDYRYFPDPDLPPIRITPDHLEEIRRQIPELPTAKAKRLATEYGLEESLIAVVIKSNVWAQWYEQLFKLGAEFKITASQIVNAIDNQKVEAGLTSDPKTVLSKISSLYKTEEVSDDDLDTAIQKIIEENPDAVAKFKAGDQKVLGFFMGQVMRLIEVKADAQLVSARIRQKLSL